MRPVIENWLTGLYWDVKFPHSNKRMQKRITEEYNKFRKQQKYRVLEEDWNEVFGKEKNQKHDKRYFNQEFLLRWLLIRDIIDGKFKSDLQKKIGALNRYLHPSFKEIDLSKPKCTACPSCVIFNEREYIKSIQIFQDIVTLLLSTFYEYIITLLPEETKNPDVEKALKNVLDLPTTEKDIGRQIIFSKELKEFIVRVENDLRN